MQVASVEERSGDPAHGAPHLERVAGAALGIHLTSPVAARAPLRCLFRASGSGGPKPPPPGYPKELLTIGDHITKRRLELGLLQREVAERLGVDKATVGDWERGDTEPHLRSIPGIVEFLGYVPFAPDGSLPQRLKLGRRLLGLSQRELADRLGVDESTVRVWEAGRYRPIGHYRERIQALLASFLRDLRPMGRL